MERQYIDINNIQLAFSAVLILINIGISVALKLGLGKRLGIAAIRMVVQLLLVGYVLEWIFTVQSPAVVLALALLMTAIAGQAAMGRTRRRFVGLFWNCFLSVLAAAALMTGLIVGGVLRVDPWYDPQYVIPLLGMILGNALTGISLAVDRFLEDLATQTAQVESLLALGATRWEATHPLIQSALRTGMIPTINSMMVMGIVSLPGMMTGQILAGAQPSDAVRYQIVIMFAIASGTAIATIGIVLLSFYRLSSSRHQLRLDRVSSVN
jgi:putative ABC transport system permease protein